MAESLEASGGAEVQRMAIHGVLRSPGQPMETGLRQEMEQRFGGANFESVRFHTGGEASESAEELQAQAYTMDNHVVFNSGFERNKHVVAHELAHVVDNMEGRSFVSHDYGDGVSVSDPGGSSEVSAENTARRVMNSPIPDAVESPKTEAVSRRPKFGVRSAPRSGAGVQRALKVGPKDYTAVYKNETIKYDSRHHAQILQKLVMEIEEGFQASINTGHLSIPEAQSIQGFGIKIRSQIARAIVDPVGEQDINPVLNQYVGNHPDFGAKNRDIQVNNFVELARNMNGWVRAKQNRHEEKRQAVQLHQDRNLDTYLNVLLRRLHGFADKKVPKINHLDSRQVKIMTSELKTGRAHVESQLAGDPERKAGKAIGAYIDYFDGEFNPKWRREGKDHLDARIVARGGLHQVMADPVKYNLREKMIALHDLSEYFGHSRHTPETQGKRAVGEIGERESLSTTHVYPNGERAGASTDRAQNPLDGQFDRHGIQKTHPSTRNENSHSTKLARQFNMPVWAGQSFTAARMFKMAETAGATPEEIAAMAWGIFAFWRTDFDHTTTFAYHTLHEVMDIAHNFGVHYNITRPYESKAMLDPQRPAGKLDAIARDTEALYRDADAAYRAMVYRAKDPRARWSARDDQLLVELRNARDQAAALQTDVKNARNDYATWSTANSKDRSTLLTRTIKRLENFVAEGNLLNRRLGELGVR
ncbi:DUF4157 domain-containing protein [Streptomyces paludis]|uniref:DUF4157 domain-containing protein n=1 Tax=Streptomyces paludis TaxID=2282738 RepID=A0A345HJR8_9ACTN|nr:DUF4157 domain-containing protein [Streptomyces paludis]